MATRQTINRFSGRIDQLATRFGVHREPAYVIVGYPSEAPAAIAGHVEQFPQDRERKLIVIVTGVPRPNNERR